MSRQSLQDKYKIRETPVGHAVAWNFKVAVILEKLQQNLL